MNRTRTLLQTLLPLIALAQAVAVHAQTRFWVGGNGRWSDAEHWSATANGPGGAGAPRANDEVVIASSSPLRLTVDGNAWCSSLSVDGRMGAIRFSGPATAELNIAGAWSSTGDVQWQGAWPVRLSVRRAGVELDLHGARVAGDVVLDGSGSWSVISDMDVAGVILLKQGTLITNSSRITAERITSAAPGRGTVIAGRAVWMLDHMPEGRLLREILRPTSTLVVGGVVQPSPVALGGAGDRDINVCGTNPGQTPFTVNSQVVTNYNGFGVRCRGDCNATVTVTVTGGSGNFAYAWLNGGPATATWTTACGGPQLVVVTDITQGISCPVQVNVTEPAPIGVIFFGQGTPPTCADVCNGTRTALAIGGVSPATYNWNNGAGTSSSFSQLCAGLNTLVISDANNCTFDTTFFFNVQPIQPNLSFTNANCFGECDGSATVAPSGGTGSFVVTWTPAPPVQGTLSVNDLCAGNYSVRVADANGCDTTVTFSITEPLPITIATLSTSASCAGACDATATVNASGTAGPYTYAWSPAPGGGQGTSAATGLCAGLYNVLVTDVPSGCDTLVPITITAPPPFDVQSTISDATCANACDGLIGLTVSGGTPGYTFLWSPVPPNGQGTANVSGLCPGDHDVTITDAAGCDTTLTFTVNAPPPLAVVLVTTDASCAGVCDGEAGITVSGGTPTYTFTWAPAPPSGQGTTDVSGLCAGNYTITVADANGCDTTLAFTINEPPPLSATSSQTSVTCGSLCDGTVAVVVAGGTPSYTYVWTPEPATGQGTPSATGFCAGAVSVRITDANGCELIVPFTIADAVPIQISLQITPASCPDVCDGTAGVIVTGGVAPYAYDWDPAPGAGQGTASASGLCPQAYSLTISDAVGCDTTISFTITAPAAIAPNATRTDVTCAGGCDGSITLAPTGGTGLYTYTWVPAPPLGQGTPNASGLCAGDWSVTITSGACDTTVVFTIVEPLPITAVLTTTNASCPGDCDGTASVVASGGTPLLTYLWTPAPGAGQGTPTAGGLCPGSYSLLIADGAGCDTTIVFQILAPTPIIPALSTTPETCAGPCTGTATVAPTGGTGLITADWQPAPGGGQGTFNATGLCAGTNYTVTLTDENGCDTTVAFTILPSATIVPNISSTPVSCNGVCDGTATVGPTGGQAPYTYDWSPPPPVGQGTPSVSGLCAGTVQVTITDFTGCTVVAEVLITAPPPILANATVTDPLCAGVCDGTIVLNTVGGLPPYTYAWSPAPPSGQGTSSIGGLCSGVWNVTMTDAAGCTRDESFTITEPPPLTLELSSTPSQCQVCIGTATALFGGGTGLLTLEWTNALGTPVGSSDTVTGLCAGVYTATLRDENGCTLQRTVPVTDSNGETLTTTDGTTSCPNTCDGVVSVAFTCADPTCTITWTDSQGNDLGVSANTVSGLCPGDYFVSVINASGCISIDTATVSAPIVVTLNISSTPVSCTAACDGTATVGVADGTPPFTFTWDPAPPVGQGTPSVADLCAGVYTLTVGDGNGCQTEAQVLITEPPPLVLFTSIVIDASCAGNCDGNITLLVAGGTGNYNYLWSPAPATGQGGSAAFGYCAGNVTVTITDDAGCSIQRTFAIEEPQPLQVSTSSTPSTCPNCDGTATATVIGGTGPYTFSWLLGGVEVSTDPSPTGLCGGVYSLTVRDQFGCMTQAVVQVSDSNAEVLTAIDGNKLCANVCDAVVGVDFVCSAPPCTIQWTDADGNVLAQDVTELTGLCAGVYTVQVTNGNGCVSLADAVVSPSSVIIPNISSTPATCAGTCDGTATAGPFGGVSPYTFTWTPEPGGGQGTPQATGLCAGVYEVLITDDSGCDTTVQVLITEPTDLAQQALVTPASCAGTCDGSIVVTPVGGTAGHTFTWAPVPPNGQGTNTATGLCAGDHVLTMTDANGCSNTVTYTISEPSPLVLIGGSTASECGVCNGEAFVSVSGGTAPYSYLWTLNAAIFGTQDSLQAICAGLYDVLVTDSAGCAAALLVPVQDLNGEVLSTIGDTTSCPGVCDGAVEVAFNCAEPSCVVTWYDASGTDLGLSTPQITGLCAGDYIVTVTNGIGCLSIDTASVVEPAPIVPNLSTTPLNCFGECDGTATVGPTGGVPPYTYTWDPVPSNGQGDPVAEGLCAGVAQVTIADAAGCSVVVPVLILGPPQLTADVAVVPITCNGACDADIVVTPQGGVGPYTFTWSPIPPNGQGTNAAIDLCAGVWECSITDFNGCDTLVSVTLVDPPVLEALIATTDNICFGECIGTATLAISGGVPPYAIIWTDANGLTFASDTTDVDGLCAGDFNARITDANGCFIDVPFAITEGTPIEANLVFTGETCAGPCDGVAGVSPTGGTGPFTFFWQPEPTVGQGSDQVSGLCAGNWIVVITDALGCDTTVSFTVLPYTPISDNATVTDVQCNGACDGSVETNALGGIGTLNYMWNPVPANGQGNTSATALCPGVYDLLITDAAGCDSSFTYTIVEPPVLQFTLDALISASCADAADGAIATTAFGGTPSYTFAWSGPSGFSATTEDITALLPGDYQLLLADANNCTIDTTISVDALVSIVANAGPDQQVCNGTGTTLDGSASTGVVTWSWRDENDVEIADSPTVSLPSLPPGDHLFVLIVSDGPCTSTDTVVVTSLALPIADGGPDQTIFLSETATLGGTPTGPAGSTFAWQPDSLLNNAAVPNPVASPTITTWFTLAVVAPNGCVDTDSVLVTVVPTVVIPNGFTPNGDGSNDDWQIDFIELFPDCEVEVYNRWGELLFQSVGYTKRWDGRCKDGFVPVGTYYYVIELNDERFPEPYTGPLTVIR